MPLTSLPWLFVPIVGHQNYLTEPAQSVDFTEIGKLLRKAKHNKRGINESCC